MDASPIIARYHEARAAWPFIHTAEGAHALPDSLLFAVGWRETGLRNIVGDFGHGHGVWQLDDRSHRIPAAFDGNVGAQCVTAAAMLEDLLHWAGGDLGKALAAYNAGEGAVLAAIHRGATPDSVTTGGNYGAFVRQALAIIHAEHIRIVALAVHKPSLSDHDGV